MSVLRLPVALLLTLLIAACSISTADLESVVDGYIQAVQERDLGRLQDLHGGDGPDLALEESLGAYLEGREEGWLDFDDDGIVLIRALNLGRGVYYATDRVERLGRDRAVLIQEVRLAYRSIRIETLPVGTTIYLLGEPLGTVYHPEIGQRRAAARRLLETLWVRWVLVRQGGRWQVASVQPDPRPPVTYNDTTRF